MVVVVASWYCHGGTMVVPWWLVVPLWCGDGGNIKIEVDRYTEKGKRSFYEDKVE